MSVKNDKVVFNNVIDWKMKRNKEKKKWIKLKFSYTGPNINLICTEDHKVGIINDPLRPKIEFLEAKKTKNRFLVRNINEKKIKNKELGMFNKEQLSAIVGSVLGDGFIGKELVFSHRRTT